MTTTTKKTPNPASRLRKRLIAQCRQQIKTRLLRIGGKKVALDAADPYLTLIAQQGQHFTLPVHLQPGLPNEATWNAAVLWASESQKSQMMVGYALNNDGTWRSHRWVMKGNELIEPTEEKQAYFGIVLTPRSAMELCDEAVFEAMGFADPIGHQVDRCSAQ